jgi:Lon protease-like protein
VGEAIEGFPLFPLEIVLLPSEVVPLHIFEERYKRMIDECLEEERGFGIVWMADDGLKGVGCTAEIAELLERMDDGRMNILAQGGAPFRLIRRIDDMPYPAGDVELLEDDLDEAGLEVSEEAHERYAELVDRVTDSRPSAEDLADLSAYRMAATVEFPLAAKQALLELRSEEERMRTLADLFRATMKRLDFVERAGERASSNGSVSP